MSTQDISRFLFQPRKHYVGGQLQQGRVLLDSDFNEDARLADEDQRRVLLDIVGPAGTPDGGFGLDLEKDSEVIKMDVALGGTTVTVLNYPIRQGIIYLCGLRFELEQRTVENFLDPGNTRTIGDWFVFQRDFLQMKASEAPLPMVDPEPESRHTHLAYLEAWEQTVTAVEDEELLERALGTVDTSVRIRRMARVKIAEVSNDDTCETAWQAVSESIATTMGGTFAEDGCELRSSARLRVVFEQGAAEDPCSPCTPGDVGRYLGAQNQAIRIMLVGTDRYVWALNNASPLYRVRRMTPVGGQVPVLMITPPRDESRWPLHNTVVEFLGWSAVLDNGEKVADEVGVFARVQTSFDPATNQFFISAADSAAIDAIVRTWDNNHPDRAQLPNGADPDLDYLFLRVWHQVEADDDEILLERGGPHTLLERIGLVPDFSSGGLGRPGDYWVVTVRPDTPQRIVPWDLTQLGGVAPHGTRHFFTPLQLVRLRPPEAEPEHENTEVVDLIEDCRLPLRSLTRLSNSCCTFTVGDGTRTVGDFTSIQDAVNALPVEGGKVCVLPGVYKEDIVIQHDDVTIEGCGKHTRIESPGGTPAPALIQVLGSRVTIRELSISVRGQIGILLGHEDPTAALVAQNILLEDLEIASDFLDGANRARSAIDVRRGEDVVIRRCELGVTGFLTDDAVVYLHGQRLRVEDSRVEAFRAPLGIAFGAWGGIQIAGDTSDVEIRGNRIFGGFGHGITLGSLAWIPETGGPLQNLGVAPGFTTNEEGCPTHNPDPSVAPPVVRNGITFNFQTMGELDNIRIIDNRIENMQANGISVLTLNRLTMEGGDTDLITVNNLVIERNRIVNNLQAFVVLQAASQVTKATAGAKAGQEEALGQLLLPANLPAAAILLSDGENITIRDNEIRDNGANDPQVITGIAIGFGNNVLIQGNRIQGNGLKAPGASAPRFGTAGGIVVFLAGIAANAPPDLSGNITSLNGSSLRVLNNVVEQANGVALAARATGPVAIENNYFESRGNNNTSQSPNQTYTVFVVNTGLPWESVALPASEPNPTRWTFDPEERLTHISDALRKHEGGGDEPAETGPFGQGGSIVFNNNQVTLNFDIENDVLTGVLQGFSVALGSLDDVTMIGNQLGMNVENPSLKKKNVGAAGVITYNQPPIAAHAVIIGQTANVAHNRIAEGVVDTGISLITIGGLMASSIGNVTTHKQYVANALARPPGNNVLLEPVFGDAFVISAHNLELLIASGVIFPFAPIWTNATANTLINTLLRFFLELDSVPPVVAPNPPTP